MEEFDIFDDEQDDETMDELKRVSKAKTKTFTSIINKKKLSKYELDEVML